MAENKLYEVIRKHPNPNATHDITIGNIKYKKGEKIGFNIFVKNSGSEIEAKKAIDLAKSRGWIKDFSAKTKKEEVKKDEKVISSATTK